MFFAVYPAHAGHDYESIERDGFRYRLVEREDSPVLIEARTGVLGET